MPPLAIAAGIGAIGSIAGGVLSASSQKSAAKQASAAETQAAQMNIDAAKQFRQENQANFQPWLNSGGQANSLIDSFLYGGAPGGYYPTQGTATPQTAPSGAGGPPTGVQQAPVAAQTPVFTPAHSYGGIAGGLQGMARRATGFNGLTQDLALPQSGPQAPGNSLPGLNAANALLPPSSGTVNTPAQAGGQTGGQNPMAAGSGYQAFVNSPYYQFPYQQGLDALNNGYAAKGMIESGAAMKGITKFGQDYGYGKMMDYLGLAGQQSNRGLQGAGAIAGVGLNALNTVTSSNTASGNALANNALAAGAANGQMYAGIGSALGGLGGSLFGGSSYGGISGGGGGGGINVTPNTTNYFNPYG